MMMNFCRIIWQSLERQVNLINNLQQYNFNDLGKFWVEHLTNCLNKQVKLEITGWEYLEDFALGLKGTSSEKWFLDLTNENDNMICWREILLSEDFEDELKKCKLCI